MNERGTRLLQGGQTEYEGKATPCPRRRLRRCQCSEAGEPAGGPGAPKQASWRRGPRRAGSAVERGGGTRSPGTGKGGRRKQTAAAVVSCGRGPGSVVRRPEAQPGLSAAPGVALRPWLQSPSCGARGAAGRVRRPDSARRCCVTEAAGGQRLPGKGAQARAGPWAPHTGRTVSLRFLSVSPVSPSTPRPGPPGVRSSDEGPCGGVVHQHQARGGRKGANSPSPPLPGRGQVLAAHPSIAPSKPSVWQRERLRREGLAVLPSLRGLRPGSPRAAWDARATEPPGTGT